MSDVSDATKFTSIQCPLPHVASSANEGQVNPATTPMRQTGVVFHEFHPYSDSKSENDNGRRANIITELRAVHGAVLLFLDNICSSKITVLDELGNQVWSREAKLTRSILSTVGELHIVETQIAFPPKMTSTSRFHISSYPLPWLLKNEEGNGSKANGMIKWTSSRPVVLAFLVAENGEPVTGKQDVFAITPIRKGPFDVSLSFIQ